MAKYAGYKLALIAALALYWPVLAQDQASEEPSDTGGQAVGELPEPEGDEAADSDDGDGTSDATSDDDAADDEVIDDSDLDEQVYEEDEDDFIPSEEIPVDEAIPFPIDI